MSNYNQPAFPTIEHGFDKLGTPSVFTTEGMTLRDYFAAKALTAIISLYSGTNNALNISEDAKTAFEYADAMLTSRNI